ncbi:hypothetical protein [Okeania hirsuta]|nr:hypothetical protein [Okeania hirsuta]
MWLEEGRRKKEEELKKETGDRRQETGGKLHGDSLPQVILNTV